MSAHDGAYWRRNRLLDLIHFVDNKEELGGCTTSDIQLMMAIKHGLSITKIEEYTRLLSAGSIITTDRNGRWHMKAGASYEKVLAMIAQSEPPQ